jgi:hypothetical protein
MKRLILAAVLVTAFAGVLQAASAKFTVTEIAASGAAPTDGKAIVDTRLAALKDRLLKSYRTFGKYAYVSSKSSTLQVSATGNWQLSDNVFLDLTLTKAEGEGRDAVYTFQLDLYKKIGDKRKTIVKPQYHASKGKVLFVGLPRKESGETPIIALKVD